MLNNPSNDAKRRPVDALFGDSQTPSQSNYIVEPAKPATTITPPIIESDDEPQPSTLTTTEHPTQVELPAAPTIVEPARIALSTPASDEDPRFVILSFQIEHLYDQVKAELQDSPKITAYCFDLLLQARRALELRDYARAEFFTQSTDAKLKRSALSVKTSRRPIVFALWAWEILAFVLGIGIIAISFIPSLTLFNLPVATEYVILLRALGAGMIGGVLGALYNLPWFIQFREYDPAYNMHYFARPLLGLVIGAVLFLISQAGILAGNIIIGDFRVGPIFLYVFAVLAGFKQEYVAEFIDNLMKAVFRAPRPPSGLKQPQNKG